jgi:23S rRNA (guanosine2251-2'-O)-methyltransferase
MNYVVLNNIRSGWNVGSIFRSCDALGFGLILVGYTSKPVGKNLKIIHKTAIGAEDHVKWEYFSHPQEVFETYKDQTHFSIEISKTSQDLFAYLKQQKEFFKQNLDTKKDVFFWFGNEIHGLPLEITEKTKVELHLPMSGTKESLNISSTVCALGYLIRFVESS